MPKKRVVVKNAGKPSAAVLPARKNIDVERALIENFVSLQKVMTNLSMSFDNLSGRINKLLDLFEISAKTLAERGDSVPDKQLMGKIDALLDQNKILARGISMLHENNSPSSGSGEEEGIQPYSPPPQAPKRVEGGDGYQKSIYSKP